MSFAPAAASTYFPVAGMERTPHRLSSVLLGGVRLSALIEIFLFLSGMLAADLMFGRGDRFIGIAPHPFWIIVLLVILQYGIAEALAAAALASAFLLAGNMPLQSLTETMYEYAVRVGLLPLLWFAAALVLGGIRARQLQEREQLQERLKTAEEEKHLLAEGYRTVKASKENLEVRLAEESRSVAMVYDAVKTLEAANAASSLDAAAQFVRVALNPKKFSLFRLNHDALELEVAHGWDTREAYTNRFELDAPLTQAILKQQHMLSIVNDQDELLLDGQGILAGAIIDHETGRVFGMLKIEDIGFMDMGIRTHKTFHVACEWLARAYRQAEIGSRPTSGGSKIVSMNGARVKKKFSIEGKAHAAL